jgi:hypothetical protein
MAVPSHVRAESCNAVGGSVDRHTYAFAYDMAAIAIPAAFLAADQLRQGLLRGDQTA